MQNLDSHIENLFRADSQRYEPRLVDNVAMEFVTDSYFSLLIISFSMLFTHLTKSFLLISHNYLLFNNFVSFKTNSDPLFQNCSRTFKLCNRFFTHSVREHFFYYFYMCAFWLGSVQLKSCLFLVLLYIKYKEDASVN